MITVQTRRARIRRHGAIRFKEYPELRLTNAWLAAAGFDPGDQVLVESPQLQTLVITMFRRRNPEAPVGYKPTVPLRPIE